MESESAVKDREDLTEGWVRFVRFHCRNNSHIDRWRGDFADNPNSPEQTPVKLNATTTWYRFPGGEWIQSRNFKEQDLAELIICDRKHYSALSILQLCKKNK